MSTLKKTSKTIIFSNFFLMTLFVMSFCVFADDDIDIEKYKNFELNTHNGIFTHDIALKKRKTPAAITSTLAGYYGFSEDKMKGSYKAFSNVVKSYISLGNGQYAVVGEIINNIKRGALNRCDFTLLRRKPDNSDLHCSQVYLAIVNIETRSVNMLDTDIFPLPEIGISSYLFDGWSTSYQELGCRMGNPFTSTDLDLDGKPELIFIGGLGSVASYTGQDTPEYGSGADLQGNVFIFDLKKNIRNVFVREISYTNFEEDIENRFPRYQSTGLPSASRLPSGKHREDLINLEDKRGYRRYSKLFFKDFDMNGKLDILAWTREYRGRMKSDPVRGYKFEKESFELYEESGKGFTQRILEEQRLKKYLASNDLTWRKGFPNKNLCHGQDEKSPLIESFGSAYEKLNIEDPVLMK